LNIVHFQRKPRKLGNFSVESYFNTIRDLAPRDIDIRLKISRFESKGIFQRLYNIIEAFFLQGDINHITGDVHFLTLLLKRKKTILTVLDCGMLKQVSGFKLNFLKYFWFTLPSKKAAYITVISQATKIDLLNYIDYDPDKIKVIYVNIADQYQPAPRSFNADKPVILQIGTAKNKNLQHLIPALAGIPCKLQILGKLDPEQKELLSLHQLDYENIDQAISDQQVYDLYLNCDILSLVSTLEGFGMPIVEANAMGRVVITGTTTSMPEIAGDAACLVDPFEVDEIHTGFQKVISDQIYRDQLISNGYQNALRFNKNNIASQYYDLYRRVAGGG